jgi:hypothetical protein
MTACGEKLMAVDRLTQREATKFDLVESALHAPSASFSDEEFYPDFCTRLQFFLCVWQRIIHSSTAIRGLAG